jgi:cytochrome c2
MHALEHLSFFGTALLLWWTVLQPLGRRRTGYPASILLLGGTLMQSGALGALLMFARTPWYPLHAAGARAWGMSLLADQQLAGLIMWVPAGFVYVIAAALLFMQWMRTDEQRDDEVARVIVPAWVPRVLIVLVIVSVAACGRGSPSVPAQRVENGNADRGRAAIARFGCGTCHAIPGLRDANGMVGPPLDHWSQRRLISGRMPNVPDSLIRWIRFPQSVEPGTGMPNMGVSDAQARDIAAYLYTLH